MRIWGTKIVDMDENENAGMQPTEADASADTTASDQKFLDQQRRAEKAENEAKLLKLENDRLKNLSEGKQSGPDRFELLNDLHSLSHLKPDEVEAVKAEAKKLGADPITYVKSESAQALLEKIRTQKRITETTPPPSMRTAQPGEVVIRDAADVTIKDGKIVKSPAVSFQEWQASKAGKGSAE